MRALQKRELLSSSEGDEIFELVDKDHGPLMKLHSQVVMRSIPAIA